MPSREKPHGTEIDGTPETLKANVQASRENGSVASRIVGDSPGKVGNTTRSKDENAAPESAEAKVRRNKAQTSNMGRPWPALFARRLPRVGVRIHVLNRYEANPFGSWRFPGTYIAFKFCGEAGYVHRFGTLGRPQ